MKNFCFFVLFAIFSYGIEVSSIEANFVQSSKTQPIFYEGKFVALTPNLAKWEYIQPLKKTVYVTQNKLISYEPMLSQVVITKINSSLDFIAILKNAKQDSKDSNLYHSLIGNVHYTLTFSNHLPQKIEYIDQLGESVVIELKDVKINTKVNKKIFEFEIPSGIDVIEQ